MIRPGAIFDRYELLRPLAAGGMGEIYLARLHGAAGFGSLVAIKVLISNLSNHSSFVSMFLDEARNVAKLRHRNIVQIRDIGQHADQYYMVMEYIPGQNLRELLGDMSIADNPLFAPKLAADMFSDLASALAAVHHAGLVHRDLSPNNIMIGDEGAAKLIDFGVARALGSASLTMPGTLKGKFTYMAPEYVRSQAYDHRVDLFSLGIVMWETFTRRRLFRGVNAAEQLHQVLEAPIPRLDDVVESFPPALADVVAGLLVRDPDRRLSNAGDVADQLRELSRELPENGERTLRKWLDRRVGDRIAERRRRDLESMELGAASAEEPSAEIIISKPPSGSGPSAPPLRPSRVSGFHNASMSSGTSIRIASGEATPSSEPPPARKRGLAITGVAIAAVAILVAVSLRRGGGDDDARAAPAAAAAAPAPKPADRAEPHRQRALEAIQTKNYTAAISELAEAIRIGGANPDLLQLMEIARRLQHDEAALAAPPSSSSSTGSKNVQTK